MNILYKGNEVMWRNHPVAFTLLVFLSLVTLGLGLLILIPWWINCLFTILTITDDRAILQSGFLSKSTTEVFLRDARMVNVSQSLLQRIFRVGDIEIATAGTAGVEISISGILRPDYVKQLIMARKS